MTNGDDAVEMIVAFADAALQRLREANAVLMEAVEHYADSRVWTQSAFE